MSQVSKVVNDTGQVSKVNDIGQASIVPVTGQVSELVDDRDPVTVSKSVSNGDSINDSTSSINRIDDDSNPSLNGELNLEPNGELNTDPNNTHNHDHLNNAIGNISDPHNVPTHTPDPKSDTLLDTNTSPGTSSDSDITLPVDHTHQAEALDLPADEIITCHHTLAADRSHEHAYEDYEPRPPPKPPPPLSGLDTSQRQQQQRQAQVSYSFPILPPSLFLLTFNSFSSSLSSNTHPPFFSSSSFLSYPSYFTLTFLFSLSLFTLYSLVRTTYSLFPFLSLWDICNFFLSYHRSSLSSSPSSF
uniref:Uncharacterized protein n=1 Tax=Aureoumbra lagunensis TaxID=44058 RepID=A0A7S3JS66_9STRA